MAWTLPAVLFDPISLSAAAVGGGSMTLLVVVACSAWLPSFTALSIERIQFSPGESLVYGVVGVLVAALFSLLLLATLVGGPAAVFLAAGVLAAVGVGSALAFFALVQSHSPASVDEEGALWLSAVLAGGLWLVPVLGGLTVVTVGVTGFGGMVWAVLDY